MKVRFVLIGRSPRFSLWRRSNIVFSSRTIICSCNQFIPNTLVYASWQLNTKTFLLEKIHCTRYKTCTILSQDINVEQLLKLFYIHMYRRIQIKFIGQIEKKTHQKCTFEGPSNLLGLTEKYQLTGIDFSMQAA